MRIISFLLLFAMLAGCSSDKTTSETKNIPDEQLIDLLVDLHLADAARGSNELADAVNGGAISADYDAVLLQHHIKEEDFRATMMYYSAHPEELAQLYDSVIEKLTALQGKTVN